MKHRIVVLGAGYDGAFAAGNLARRLSPADTFEQREPVTLAVLTLLERLSPAERAVYVLREAFSYSHAEIAAILDITEAASRQHAHRARTRVASAAAMSGRTDRLEALLTDDVTAVSDGAGLARRLLRYRSRERVASFVRAGFKPTPAKRRLAVGSPSMHLARVNGTLAVVAVVGDRVVGAVAFEVRDGKVASLCGIAATDRLARLDEAWRHHEPGVPVIDAWWPANDVDTGGHAGHSTRSSAVGGNESVDGRSDGAGRRGSGPRRRAYSFHRWLPRSRES